MAEKTKATTHGVSVSRAKPKDIVEESQRVYPALLKIGLIVGGLVAIFILGWLIYLKIDEPSEVKMVTERATRSAPAIPLASSPQAEWPKVMISPKGRSELFPIPPGMHANTTAEDFLLHVVYADGRDCEVSTGCPEGGINGFYFENKSNRTIIVAYAFEKA